MSRGRAIAVSEWLAAASTLASSLEYLTARDKFGAGGVNDWAIIRQNTLGRGAIQSWLLDAISTERRTVALHYARAAVSAGILLPIPGRWRGYGNAFLTLGTVLLSPRHRYGSDGSDQVTYITQAVVATARLSRKPAVQDAALWYGAMQAGLAYCAPGWLKLMGEQWRSGSALSRIIRTRTYGHPGLYAVMRRYPKATALMSHATVAWECLFPIVFVRQGRLIRPMLATGLGFHIVNGFAMGLGRFLTAFPSMYPMLAYATAPRSHPAVADRDDRAVRVTLAAVLAAAAAAGIVAARKRIEVLDGWPKSRTMTTRCGNRLQYKPVGDWHADAPVLVLLPDRAETPEHFSWLIDRVTQSTGCGVVSYSRAGYGASRRRARTPFGSVESVEDLIDLLDEAVPADRRIVLVGHGFGGVLARRAVGALPDRIHAVVYLDHTHAPHPDDDDAAGTNSAREWSGIRQITWSLRAGLGILVTRPRWLDDLPYLSQRQVYAQWSDARMWRATAREYRAVQEDYASGGERGPVAGHAVVISAQQCIDESPKRRDQDRELADQHRRAGYRAETVVVDRADRQGLLTNQRYAVQVADHIVRFLEAVDRPVVQLIEGPGSPPEAPVPSEGSTGGAR